jgi:lysophospholipase L1-like esterase
VLDEAAAGRRLVRIAAWGASHVAGEYFTGELRRQLQTQGGDGGHGFVMPAAPWKGYRATDVNLCTTGNWVSDYVDREGSRRDGMLGPMGISVEASTPESSAWVQTTRTNPQGRSVSRFEVMYLKQPAGGHVDLVVDNAPRVQLSTKGATGPGVALIEVADGPHRLTLTPTGDGPVRLFGVNMERPGPGVVVDAAGVIGRTAASWLEWNEPLQAAYLGRRRIDLAILAYGTNEANDPRLDAERYREQLRGVLRRMRSVLPAAACLLVGPSDRGKKTTGNVYVIWSRTQWVAQVQREVGPEFGCVTWDLQAATGGPGSVYRLRELTPAFMAPDLIHFTAEGYRELARRLLGAVRMPAG